MAAQCDHWAVLGGKNSLVVQPTGSVWEEYVLSVPVCCLWQDDSSYSPNNQPHPRPSQRAPTHWTKSDMFGKRAERS